MFRKRLFAQLFPWFLFVTLAPLALVLAVTWKVVDDFHMEQTQADLLTRVELFRLGLDPVSDQGPAAVDAFCKRVSKWELSPEGVLHETRFTVISPDGAVLGDSVEDPASLGNHADRPEIRAARNGRVGISARYSDTLGRPLLYAAIPLRKDGIVKAVIRASLPLDSVRSVQVRVTFRILVMGLLTALLSAGIGLYASRLLAEPLEEMEQGARRFAAGDLKTPIPVPDSLEMANLAEALNAMATRLDERIRTETRQRREREAVLASMGEGVLAIDMEWKIIGMNAAAARLLHAEAGLAGGRSILEVVRNPELGRFVADALQAETSLEADLALHDKEDVFLQVCATPLRGHEERRLGIVVVLNDVTRLRRLEAVRREFVANASHELRTPITSIRGFAETLEDGAADDPESSRRFAGIIAAHAKRLELLVEDMLTLSRLEHVEGRERLHLERQSVRHILEAAAAVCEGRAQARAIRLVVECPEDLTAALAGSLMEQAVVNLLDNAIKYSEDGQEVLLRAEAAGGKVTIRVRDRGCGIEKKHLPHLFERFYRVDNARSRKLGGTGLGLAIVKHIVLAHGGEAGVTSAPGAGSEFTISLPQGGT